MAIPARSYLAALTRLESTPHKHGFRKTALELTEEMSIAEFLEYVKTNICWLFRHVCGTTRIECKKD